MAVVLERIAGGEQENGGKQIPLDFEPGIGRTPESIADERVDRRHHGGSEHKPERTTADALIESIDEAGECDQNIHGQMCFLKNTLTITSLPPLRGKDRMGVRDIKGSHPYHHNP